MLSIDGFYDVNGVHFLNGKKWNTTKKSKSTAENQKVYAKEMTNSCSILRFDALVAP